MIGRVISIVGVGYEEMRKGDEEMRKGDEDCASRHSTAHKDYTKTHTNDDAARAAAGCGMA